MSNFYVPDPVQLFLQPKDVFEGQHVLREFAQTVSIQKIHFHFIGRRNCLQVKLKI
jgi:hypothetical protein